MLNAIYGLGHEHADLYPGVDDPGLQAMREVVSELLGLPINYEGASGPMDFDEFTLTGNLRVDDGISDAVKDMQLNNACAVATKFQSIAGVLSYSFNNSKLMPRVKADIVLGPDNNCNPWP